MIVRKIFAAFGIACGMVTAASAQPSGWPKDLAIGSVINGGGETKQFIERPVFSAFTYAGVNGAGDRGQVISPDTKVYNIVSQIRTIEGAIGRTMMPTIVFYSIDGSDGAEAIKLDVEPINLDMHYRNLISLLKQLEGYRSASHPVPATLLLNPDFLGELQKQCGKWYCPVPLDMPVPVKAAITSAFTAFGIPVSEIPAWLLQDKQSWPVYVQSINWLVRKFGPHVPFGWHESVWAGDETGHGWIHKAHDNQPIIDQHSAAVVSFLKKMQVYSDGHPEINPDFLAFDKYERDTFTCNDHGGKCDTYSNAGYLYNARDMHVYLKYISGVSTGLGNVPTMLWQIPGGHMQTTLSAEPDRRGNHASTEVAYLLGQPELTSGLTNLQAYYGGLPIPSEYYNNEASTVHDYMVLCPSSESKECLQHDHLSELRGANVFAILFGGGSTTGVSGLSPELDDNGWLYDRLNKIGLDKGNVH
ncbi:hypothetical protein [Burkholderia sp. Ac-20344]|uniref:hypothetical protein n=1 Tax=Burkholderia sp. Ac-20344 TaxID=2703890 RepID=UPI00197B6245|nr:hypothetical protein [Burkholderia sp. Ac-20344]MBN3836270.1 hypothetical protein [Burkholderia sp. Ac-20344]